MKKLYQTNWFEIEFKELQAYQQGSTSELPSQFFYDEFYSKFYKKYSCYNSLDDKYLRGKEEVANFLIQKIKLSANPNVLSFGCGIGYVEQCICNQIQQIDLYLLDSPLSTKWMKQYIDEKFIHTELQSLGNLKFDLIYLSHVEYALTDSDLITLFRDLRSYLNPKGSLILIKPVEKSSSGVLNLIKGLAKNVLSLLRLYDRGQFWGYSRNPHEIAKLLQEGGFDSEIQQTTTTTMIEGYNLSCVEAFMSRDN